MKTFHTQLSSSLQRSAGQLHSSQRNFTTFSSRSWCCAPFHKLLNVTDTAGPKIIQELFLCVSAPPITSMIWQPALIQQNIPVFCICSGSLWLQLGVFSHLKSSADFAVLHSNSFLLCDYITPASPSLHYSVKHLHSLKLSLANHIPLALLLFHNKIMCPEKILHQMFVLLSLTPDTK